MACNSNPGCGECGSRIERHNQLASIRAGSERLFLRKWNKPQSRSNDTVFRDRTLSLQGGSFDVFRMAAPEGVIDGLTLREDPSCGGTTRMVAMDGFDHLLTWKLKAGSHRFPGPDGGTCINEAALVAAGFAYKPIHIVEQMPGCFSRPICRLAMALNDLASDKDRQRLLPYVTRLACADTKAIERAREAYIRRHIGHYHSCHVGCDFYAGLPLSREIALSFDKGLEVLEGALAIGRQADPLGPEEVLTRMEAARTGRSKPTRTATPASGQDEPLFSKVKSWLTMKETEPAA